MPDETLSVRDDGSWKTVKFPYVYDTNVSSNQQTPWKKIHKVWVYDGGTWKVGHRTNWDDYDLVDTRIWYSEMSYTVPAGIKYLEVTLVGHGGGGGGRAGATPHYGCISGTNPDDSEYHTHTAQATAGGTGGKAYAVFEVAEGAVYYVDDHDLPFGGYANNQTMQNQGGYSHDLNATWNGGSGAQRDVTLNTDDDKGKTNIYMVANGGDGGNAGRLTVSARCFDFSDRRGYTLSGSYTGNGSSSVSNGTGVITVSSGSTETQTTTTGGGLAGGAAGGYTGSDSAPAGAGSAPSSAGYIQIKEWGYSI